MPSGKLFDKDGNFIERPKLVADSMEHKDVTYIHFNGNFDGKNDWFENFEDLEEKLPEGAIDR
jgi:hypothetical protein